MPAYYIAEIARKRKEIERLNECQGSMQVKQGEFDENVDKCLDPELTITTWHGNHASEFDDIRNSGIHTPYLEIAGAQFSKVFAAIAKKIEDLEAEIVKLQQIIDSILAARAAQAAQAAGIIR